MKTLSFSNAGRTLPCPWVVVASPLIISAVPHVSREPTDVSVHLVYNRDWRKGYGNNSPCAWKDSLLLESENNFEMMLISMIWILLSDSMYIVLLLGKYDFTIHKKSYGQSHIVSIKAIKPSGVPLKNVPLKKLCYFPIPFPPTTSNLSLQFKGVSTP